MSRIKVRWRPEGLARRPVRVLDLHVHLKLSKGDIFRGEGLAGLINRARSLGLQGFAVAEHFHARDFWAMYDALFRLFPCRDGVFRVEEGFFLLSGGEVSLQEGQHLVILAPPERLYDLDHSFPRPLSAGHHPALPELLEHTEGTEALLIAAHPFRSSGLPPQVLPMLARLDAVEANGRDLDPPDRILRLAQRLGLPVVGGSDAHHVLQLGTRATVLPAGPAGFTAVASAIRQGRAGLAELSGARWMVGLAVNYKRMVKAGRRFAALLRGGGGGNVPSGRPTRPSAAYSIQNLPEALPGEYGNRTTEPPAAEESGGRAPVGI
ncbi:MAG: PHP domain-containing protein [Clostridia bacterium]|jgi:hypothetical protein|nr:PHP domain-containing protein [Clostridia bacterium]MDH7573065.1 PHP domain-containing protein [Clostridia bacterium]